MKTGSPAYHLRTNKAVERLLFTELLKKLAPYLPVNTENYWYIGLGGPYLEDFSEVQHVLGCRRMTSLEVDSHVLMRQRFNKPHCRIILSSKSTGQFVSSYTTTKMPLVVWFDYTKHDWVEQIRECCELIPKLPNGSIFKVTFKSTPSNLCPKDAVDPLSLRVEKLEAMFSSCGGFSTGDVSLNGFPKTLIRILKSTIKATLGDTDKNTLFPLSSFYYNDGTPMLTVTMLTGDQSTVDSVISKSQFKNWKYADLAWDGPMIIDVPSLSLRERLAIDRMLPDKSPDTIVKRLRLSLAETPADTLVAVSRYVDYSKHIPNFMRVATS